MITKTLTFTEADVLVYYSGDLELKSYKFSSYGRLTKGQIKKQVEVEDQVTHVVDIINISFKKMKFEIASDLFLQIAKEVES